ncbi:MAG: hypothetical protein FWC34_00620 [Bacteroidetes bacterium]|nr:hypothetical protein [Bacteroidota bacterium]
MNKNAFKVLEEIAAKSFSNPYAGLHTIMQMNKQFTKYAERNYRIKKFHDEHIFLMTQNEREFHFMGFMNAIIWLSRSNMLKRADDRVIGDDDHFDLENFDDLDPDEEELKIIEKSKIEEKAIWNFITCYETGEEFPFDK